MINNWINIEGDLISLEDTPNLLIDLKLMPLFLRRYFERKFTKDIKPSEEEQIIFQKRFMAREKITDQESLQNWIKVKGITESDLNLKIYEALKLEMFKKEKFNEYAENVFLKRKSDLDRVTYSLIRAKSREKIVELNIRLNEEEATFSELSSEFSEGFENMVNGLIGPIELGQTNPVLAERLKSSKPGKIWPPFELENWWILLRLERYMPAKLNDTMRNRLVNEMYESWILEKIKKTLDELNNNSIKE